MIKKIVPGEFVVGTVINLPHKNGPGFIRWENEKSGVLLRAPFRFEQGARIMSGENGSPTFVDGRTEPASVENQLIAIVRPGRGGLFVSVWGHKSEYDAVLAKLRPAPKLPGRAHVVAREHSPARPASDAAQDTIIRKFNHGGRSAQPRRGMTIAMMATAV